ncbi:hypothetical protein HPB47_013831 [Ixodes persulcatus]|uniref:Uncharacterized protein n=1 Tax=Ixodes persulcatus TaxID=34615 RepID=A0AC60R095_IXOPE|nr:hypothetical protein HPB47_013831 [Ixodes persulcatus]
MGSGASPWVLRRRPMAEAAAAGGARPMSTESLYQSSTTGKRMGVLRQSVRVRIERTRHHSRVVPGILSSAICSTPVGCPAGPGA